MLITLPWSLTDVHGAGAGRGAGVKTLSPSPCLLSAEVEQGNTAFLLQVLYCKQVSCSCSVSHHVFHIFVFLLVISLFKMTPKSSAKVLCSVPKPKKAVTGLVLDRLASSV